MISKPRADNLDSDLTWLRKSTGDDEVAWSECKADML